MESWYIPQHLDTPPRILMFTIPEGVVMLICFFAGTATSTVFRGDRPVYEGETPTSYNR